MDNFENIDIGFKNIEPLYGDKSVNKYIPGTTQKVINNNTNSYHQTGKMIPEGKAINTTPKELNYVTPKYQGSKIQRREKVHR